MLMINIVKICYYDGKVIIPYSENIIIISVAYAGIVSELVPAYYVISLFILISTSDLVLRDFSVEPVLIQCGIQLSSLCYFKVHAIWPREYWQAHQYYTYIYIRWRHTWHITKRQSSVATIMFSVLQLWLL